MAKQGTDVSRESLHPEPWAEYKDDMVAIHFYKKGSKLNNLPGVQLGHTFKVESPAVAKEIVRRINEATTDLQRCTEFLDKAGIKYEYDETVMDPDGYRSSIDIRVAVLPNATWHFDSITGEAIR